MGCNDTMGNMRYLAMKHNIIIGLSNLRLTIVQRNSIIKLNAPPVAEEFTAGLQGRPPRNAHMECRLVPSTWRNSKHRNIRWAGKERNRLRKLMGYACWRCGKRKRSIHFDVIVPVHPPDFHGRKLSWDQRMRCYKKHYEAGNCRLSCATCNGHKGATEDKQYHQLMRLAGQRQAGDDDVEHTPASTVTDDVPF